MYTPEDRDRLRSELIAFARLDPRLTGGAITGSASVNNEDLWSDVDLGFGVRDATELTSALADFSERMYREHSAVNHLDVVRDPWIYRVFLLPSTLQVDLAFAPATHFGARAPTFRLVFGTAAEPSHLAPPTADELIGYGWLYALHARSSIARSRPWQAEYMLSAMRDQILSVACLRFGLPAREARGIDRLPREVTKPLEETLVRSLEPVELLRAFQAATTGLLSEIRTARPELASDMESVLHALTETAALGSPHATVGSPSKAPS